MINKIIYNINESFKNLWRNRVMSMASIASVAATLVILGIIFSIILNVNLIVGKSQENFDEIVVYLKDSTYDQARIKEIIQETEVQDKEKSENQNKGNQEEKVDTGSEVFKEDTILDEASAKIDEYKAEVDKKYKKDVESIQEDIKRIIGVKNVKYISKDESFAEWKVKWADNSYLLDGISSNPLPNSLIVKLKNLDFSNNVVSILNSFDIVEDIRFDQAIITTVVDLSNIIKSVGFILIFILLGITMFMITNTINIAVNSRYKEIRIMKYVGATNWFIRWPFILEGIIMGFIGAIIAGIVIFFGYDYAFNYIMSNQILSIVGGVIPTFSIMADIFFIYIVLGVGVGALGSIVAIRKHLNV